VSTGVNGMIRNFGAICPTGDWGALLGLGSNPMYLSWAEPHLGISPSGARLLFGSDWGNGLWVDTYVVELPTYSPDGSNR
jgi:hypothetical protein